MYKGENTIITFESQFSAEIKTDQAKGLFAILYLVLMVINVIIDNDYN